MGYSDKDGTYCLFSVLVFGVIGIGISGTIVKKTGKYKAMLLTFISLFICSVGGLMGILSTGNSFLLIGIAAPLGFFLSPCLTVGIELACEVAFPVGEAYTNGII